MTDNDKNIKMFFGIIRGDDPVYRYVLNQGWDENSNVHAWTATLSGQDQAALIVAVEDLLISENLSAELLRQKQVRRQEEKTLVALSAIDGFNDWKFLWKMLNDPRHMDKFYLVGKIIRLFSHYAPSEMSKEMKEKYLEYFKKYEESRNRGYCECATDFASAYGRLAKAEAFKDMLLFLSNDLILYQSYGSFGNMLFGVSDNKKLDYDKIREYVIAEKAKMSKEQSDMFYKILDPQDMGMKIGSKLVAALDEPELARQVAALKRGYGLME